MSTSSPTCRFCAAPLRHSVIDLGDMPLANAYLAAEPEAVAGEQAYPLHARLCERCLLVQVDAVLPPPAIFAAYPYFSSYSSSWVEHGRCYAEAMTGRLALGPGSLVVEVASNDGYLLRHFVALGVPVLGIEPAANVASVARARGVASEEVFFGAAAGAALAARGVRADLMVANNVLAHVPDIADFARGFGAVLKPEGIVTFEFPHLLELVAQAQFDTIYHEHFSYLSLLAVERVLAASGLRAFDAVALPTHGGSLRVFACHGAATWPEGPGLARIRAAEAAAGLQRPAGYAGFAARAAQVAGGFRAFLDHARICRQRVAGYGAAAKGNTFLNFCGAGTADIARVADRSPAKQGRLLPGSHIPVVAPEDLLADPPDDLVILAWNIVEEIAAELAPLARAGTRLWTAMPGMRLIPAR